MHLYHFQVHYCIGNTLCLSSETNIIRDTSLFILDPVTLWSGFIGSLSLAWDVGHNYVHVQANKNTCMSVCDN